MAFIGRVTSKIRLREIGMILVRILAIHIDTPAVEQILAVLGGLHTIRIQVVPTALIVIVRPVMQVVAPQIQLIKMFLVAVPGIQGYVEVELVMMTSCIRLKHVMCHHVLGMETLNVSIPRPAVPAVLAL